MKFNIFDELGKEIGKLKPEEPGCGCFFAAIGGILLISVLIIWPVIFVNLKHVSDISVKESVHFLMFMYVIAIVIGTAFFGVLGKIINKQIPFTLVYIINIIFETIFIAIIDISHIGFLSDGVANWVAVLFSFLLAFIPSLICSLIVKLILSTITKS